MSAWANEDSKRQRNETKEQWEARLKRTAEYQAQHAPGAYYSTQKADGSIRDNGAAAMFERYGFF